jgi:hypothetical protein
VTRGLLEVFRDLLPGMAFATGVEALVACG